MGDSDMTGDEFPKSNAGRVIELGKIMGAFYVNCLTPPSRAATRGGGNHRDNQGIATGKLTVPQPCDLSKRLFESFGARAERRRFCKGPDWLLWRSHV